MDMEFSRGTGDLSRQIKEIRGRKKSTVKPLATDNPRGGGSNWEKTLCGRYVYF